MWWEEEFITPARITQVADRAKGFEIRCRSRANGARKVSS
jgi:hypothetical protein